MKDLIKRINELANKSKTEELSSDEKAEQAQLRKKYIVNFRGAFKETLMNVKVVNTEGEDITPKKLIEEQNKRKK